MGLDMVIRIRKSTPCPHCGKDIPGDIENEYDMGGRQWYDTLGKVDYTDADYGKYKILSEENARLLAKDLLAEKADYYALQAGNAVAGAILSGDYVEFEADW